MRAINIGIIGAGRIAGTMADTIRRMKAAGNKDVELYGIASRCGDRAMAFAAKYEVKQWYGSYEAMVQDPAIDLVYIAVPHSHHLATSKLCLASGKHVLVEKAFTVNAAQARDLIHFGRERDLLVAEAIWTRYQPMRRMILDVVESGLIGEPKMIMCNLGYSIGWKERIQKPELAGGALLDVGVYTLNFAEMIFGRPDRVSASCMKNERGVDLTGTYILDYENDRQAVCCSSAVCATDRTGYIYGGEGYIEVENINNPQRLRVFDPSYQLIREMPCPKQLTGYEYEVKEAVECIRDGRVECYSMPHTETIHIMELMDEIRQQMGVHYPTLE